MSYTHSQGYKVISGDKLEHIVVAKANPDICGEWFEGCVVHHLNGNKQDNRPENLRVVTTTEHSLIHKPHLGHHHSEETKMRLSDARKGKPSPRKGVTLSEETKIKISESKEHRAVNQYSVNGDLIASYPSVREAALVTGIKKAYIRKCCGGFSKISGGYKWSYE